MPAPLLTAAMVRPRRPEVLSIRSVAVRMRESVLERCSSRLASSILGMILLGLCSCMMRSHMAAILPAAKNHMAPGVWTQLRLVDIGSWLPQLVGAVLRCCPDSPS